MKKFFYNIAGILVLAITLLGVYTFFQIEEKKPYNMDIEIGKNEPLSKALAPLPNSNTLIFKLYLKYRNGGRNIKAGYHHLEGEYSLKDVIDTLEEGSDRLVRVTIPEGLSIKQIVAQLKKIRNIDENKFYKALEERRKDFPYPTPQGNFEGYLYPETYYLPENYDEKAIVDAMLGEFLKRFPSQEYPDKAEFYHKLVMASILEKEAMINSEKPIMASVFYNRIKKNMTLSSDATVNFVFDYNKRRIYYKDLEVDSPYNTYKYKGLPPGPISNPAKDSVDSAYNPADTDYLFFVARGDGSHFFSKTYKEHLDFQKNNKKSMKEVKDKESKDKEEKVGEEEKQEILNLENINIDGNQREMEDTNLEEDIVDGEKIILESEKIIESSTKTEE